MRSEGAKRSDFKDKIAPHLGVLLQFSFWLTKNGRDSVKLMRRALAEAYRSSEEWIPEENCVSLLHRILIKQFFNGFQKHSRPLAPISGDNVDDSLVKNNRLFSGPTIDALQQSLVISDQDEDVSYFRAIAGLPMVFRSVMILSYLDGFSNRDIANLTGVQSRAVDSLLNRGRRLLREELFAHLMGNDDPDTSADLAVAAG